MVVRAFTKIILEITLLLSVALSVAYAIYLWIEKFWSGAIIFTVFAVFVGTIPANKHTAALTPMPVRTRLLPNATPHSILARGASLCAQDCQSVVIGLVILSPHSRS